MGIFMRNLDPEAFTKSLNAFQSIDRDNSGQLDKQEMIDAIEQLRLKVPDLNFDA